MFQRGFGERVFIVIALIMSCIFFVGYSVPMLEFFYTFTTLCLFGVVGTCAIILGCAGLYTVWRRGY